MLFILIYPAAFLSGLVRGKLGSRANPLRMLINVATYLALVFVVVPVVT